MRAPPTGNIPFTPELRLSPKRAQRPLVVAGLRRYLTAEEAADYFNVDRVTIYRWVDDGLLKAYRLGRNWRFLQEDLDRFLEPVNAGPVVENALGSFIEQQIKPVAP